MSQGGGVSITGSGASPVETLTGNSGGAVGPDALFNIDILGNNTTGLNVVGTPGSNTLTIVGIQSTTSQRGTVTLATDAQAIAGTDSTNVLTSSNLAAKLGTQTAHSLAVFEGSSSALTAVGPATNGQIIIGSTGLDPVFAVPTNGNNISWTTGAGALRADVTGTTNHSLQLGNASGSLTSLGVAANGQLPIGSNGVNPVLATLTAGTGISITNGGGSITIANTSLGSASLSPYIVGTTGTSDFTTIQAAINQAHTDGASATNPLQIYIKPGLYNENLTLFDGLYLIGFTGIGDNTQAAVGPIDLFPSVKVTGSLTTAYAALGSQPSNIIQNIWFSPAGGNVCTLVMDGGNNGFITFDGCIIQTNDAGGATAFVCTNHPSITLKSSLIYDGSGLFGSLFSSTDTLGVTFNSFNSGFEINGISALAISTQTSLAVNLYNSLWTCLINNTAAAGGISIFSLYSAFSTADLADMFKITNAAVTGTFQFKYCNFTSFSTKAIVNIVSTDPTVTFDNCLIASSKANSLSTYIISPSYSITDTRYGTDVADKQELFKGVYTGYSASTSHRGQSSLQTTDATNQTLVTIAVPSNQAIVITGRIIAQNSAHTDATGGSFMAVAQNNAGALSLIGSPLINLNASSTATFTVVVSGTNLIIRANGIAATTYNWISTYEYEFMATDS